jgi:hypothetical protein
LMSEELVRNKQSNKTKKILLANDIKMVDF